MKKLIFLIAIVASSLLHAQTEFAPIGAEWYFSNWYFSYDDPITFSYIKTVRDTVIDNKYCTIIYLYNNNGQDFVTDLILHEYQGKVYFFESNEFKLFFDYNINVGDTLAYRVPINAPNFQSNYCCSGVDTSRVFYAYINDITTLEIDGLELLEFHTTIIMPEDYDGTYEFWELGTFTERIGAPQGLFGKSAVEPVGGYPGFYSCYEDDEISIRFIPIGISCDYTTVNITKTVEDNLFLFYPNPVIDRLKISLLNEEYSLVELFDINGKAAISSHIEELEEIELDMSDFSSGLYILKVSSKTICISKKIIKL